MENTSLRCLSCLIGMQKMMYLQWQIRPWRMQGEWSKVCYKKRVILSPSNLAIPPNLLYNDSTRFFAVKSTISKK